MGGIQGFGSRLDGPNFNNQDSKYDEVSYRGICTEFGVDPNSDFRFTFGQNHGLGFLYIHYSNGDYAEKGWQYLTTLSNPSNQRFADEGGTDVKGNKLDHIRNDQGADRQFEHFVHETTQGLTQSCPSRLNQSIEAFVYCVIGAQVNLRSSILGDSRRAREAQMNFITLLEDAIRTLDISKSIQRYRYGKGAPEFCSSPWTWLVPSSMVINRESTVGYNNQLKQVGAGMKLGINNDVNQSTKKWHFA